MGEKPPPRFQALSYGQVAEQRAVSEPVIEPTIYLGDGTQLLKFAPPRDDVGRMKPGPKRGKKQKRKTRRKTTRKKRTKKKRKKRRKKRRRKKRRNSVRTKTQSRTLLNEDLRTATTAIMQQSGTLGAVGDVLHRRLDDFGWNAVLQSKCDAYVAEKDKESEEYDVDDIMDAVRSDPDIAMPEEVKREVMRNIRDAILRMCLDLGIPAEDSD
ncbi:hypothetical protein QR680_002707 [Steinernema hermaphroditum]|uniref:Uncharacterized protein n=1 Tax=Steinernema hermaphroditum TaxID=289476 RepID=A0AA39H4L8_9BILA|nr:hypothetical protein QR680_002707 [Steinernema hermaphroditum]